MSDKTILLPAAQSQRIPQPWGELTWFSSGQLGNTREVTVGRCIIHPGQSNPQHYHPNSSEILVVLQGTIMHAIEDGREVRMDTGDTITIPPHLPHYARNIGTQDAVLMVIFPTPNRQVENE